MAFNFKNLLFMGVPQKAITLENIKEIVSSNSTKRINFSSSHAGALKKYNDQWKITLAYSLQSMKVEEYGGL